MYVRILAAFVYPAKVFLALLCNKNNKYNENNKSVSCDSSSQLCRWLFEIHLVSRQLVHKRVTRLHNDTRKNKRARARVCGICDTFIIICIGEYLDGISLLGIEAINPILTIGFNLPVES